MNESSGNCLGDATSPYLLQHAHNPVHWREWGASALKEAVDLDRPILLSIGYAACHWCHVMAHESFEDPQTAALMNALYVPIKVDREERPDIDHLYMAALHALGEQGGWPLTMVLRPDGAPFWGGTYFPPEPRWGRPSFRQVLQGVSDAYRDRHEAVARVSEGLADLLRRLAEPVTGAAIRPRDLDDAAASLLRLVDRDGGGLRGAPKFPNAPIHRFLWQDDFRQGGTDGAIALFGLLEHMVDGGIHDHLGGGFSRYATDQAWLIPHFEKMLYDNAQMLDLLALAHADRPTPRLAACAEGIARWLVSDMLIAADQGGAFAASEDADSEGEEGRFYIWTARAIDDALGPDAPAFRLAYDVSDGGNWEASTILHRITPDGSRAEEAGLAASRAKLLARRSARVRPALDDKLLADWNGLAIAALCRAAIVFDHPDWNDLARTAFDTVERCLAQPDGRLGHAWRSGRVGAAGLLDDQACMARAALALYESSGDPTLLDRARTLVAATETHFSDGSGGFFLTADDAVDVPFGPAARPRTATDQAVPSGVGILAEVLARLHHLTGEDDFRVRAEAVGKAFSGESGALAGMPGLLAAMDTLNRAVVVVVVGDPASAQAAALRAVALRSPDPATIVLPASLHEDLPASHPASGKSPPHGHEAAAFVCRAGVCGLPVIDTAALAAALGRRAGPA